MQESTIKALFQAIDNRDWNRLGTIFHVEITYERPGYQPLVGLDRVLRFYAQERIISSGEHRIEHIMLDDTCGACWGRFVGILKNGAPADERFVDVYRFHQDAILTRRSYFFRPAI